MRQMVLGMVLALAGLGGWAAVRLPAVFSDHAVLQRGMAVPVWGWADPGEAVTVSFAGQQATATAGVDGRWLVRLAALEASATPRELIVAGKNTVTVRDVLVGEVWVCSGQSNMAFTLAQSTGAADEIAKSADPALRMFTTKLTAAAEPRTDCVGAWAASEPAASGRFSAVGYYFAKHLRQALGVPVGMLHSSWGGTAIEAWTNRAALEGDPALLPIARRGDALVNGYYAQIYAQNGPVLRDWLQQADQAKAAGQPIPLLPEIVLPGGDPRTQALPSGLYNAMIAPLVPYAIAGAIWYQGEANAGRARGYRTLLPAMIRGWRTAWGQGDFPFLIVQLPNYLAQRPTPAESTWAELREAQALATQLPKVDMAVTIDLGDEKDIHPKNKRDVGMRLGLTALKTAYGQDVTYSGPRYAGMAVEGKAICLRFTHAAGLTAPGEVHGFAIAGADKQFVWANAVIDGETVVVSSDQVPTPVAVRYAWADNPVCNLTNAAGFPAAPFRTDDWPGITVGP